MFKITVDYKKDAVINIANAVSEDVQEIAELIGETYDSSIIQTGIDTHHQQMCRAGEFLHIVGSRNDRSLQITLEDDAVKDCVILAVKIAKIFAPFYTTLKSVIGHMKNAADHIKRLTQEYESRWGEDPSKNRYAIVTFTMADEKVAVLCKRDEFDQRSIVGVRSRSEFDSAARFMVKSQLIGLAQGDFSLTEGEAQKDMWGSEFPTKVVHMK